MKSVKHMIFGTMLLLSSIVAEANDKTVNLTFGLYANDRPSALIRQFRTALKELEHNMEDVLGHNVTIHMKITKTYDDAIKLLVDGTFDFVRFGPVTYIKAKKLDDNIKIVAAESVDGDKIFYGIVATSTDSGIQVVGDLEHKRFAFGDESSTIGRYLAQQFLMDHDIYRKELDSYKYVGRYDLVGQAVANGYFDAGSLRESTFHSLVDSGYKLVELARFPSLTKPWVVSSKVTPEVADAMTTALLEIDNPKILGRLGIDGFLEVDDSDYDAIRDAVIHNYLFFN